VATTKNQATKVKAKPTTKKKTRKSSVVKKSSVKTSSKLKTKSSVVKKVSRSKQDPSPELQEISRILSKFQDHHRYPNGDIVLRHLLLMGDDSAHQLDYLRSEETTVFLESANKIMFDLIQIAIDALQYEWFEVKFEDYEFSAGERETVDEIPKGFIDWWIEATAREHGL